MTLTGSRRFTARDLALVAVFVGIMAALGLVPALYPFGAAVPITAQSMGAMLAGAILGSRRGAVAMLVFVLLVCLGLPLLAGGRGGLGVLVTPTVGFFLGFPVAAYVVGRLTELFGPTYTLARGTLANVLGGIVALYVLGLVGFMVAARVGIDAAASALLIFVPGDAIKAVVAALVARGVHAGYPGLLTERSRARQERQKSAV